MFFIPFIIGAVAAASIGTTTANHAMGGALFAPEIKGYQKDIKRELDTNDRLIDELTQLESEFNAQVGRINTMLELSNQVSSRFFISQAEASSLTANALIEDLYPTLPNPVEMEQLATMIVGGFAIMTSVMSSPSVQRAFSRNGTKLVHGLRGINAAAKNAALRIGGSVKFRAVSRAFNIASVVRIDRVTNPAIRASTRLAGTASRLGARATMSTVSRAMGPLSVVTDIAFLVTDIVASKKRAAEMKKERDRIIAANDDLRKMRIDMQYAQANLNMDEGIIQTEVLKLVKYVVPIVVFHLFSEADELPHGMQNFDQIKDKNTLTIDELERLKVFIEDHGASFIQQLNEFYVDRISLYKSYVDACDMAPESLVREHSFLGLFGLEFVRFLKEGDFSSTILDIVPIECPRDFDENETLNGWTAKASQLTSGRIREVADRYWVYTDQNGIHHPYNETHRDPWSVYFRSLKNNGVHLQLDLWRNELIQSSSTMPRTVIDTVVTGSVFRRADFEAVSDVPFEIDLDRPGRDYRTFRTDVPNDCADACGRDPVCKSFTWYEPQGRCYLKDAVPEPSGLASARSGVKVMEASPPESLETAARPLRIRRLKQRAKVCKNNRRGRQRSVASQTKEVQCQY
ncbi:MAG: PAN/Apple domain-containing protein [Myxococcota bacterium]